MTSSPACAAKAACRPAVECYKPRQTTTGDEADASEQNNTGPVIKQCHYSQTLLKVKQDFTYLYALVHNNNNNNVRLLNC